MLNRYRLVDSSIYFSVIGLIFIISTLKDTYFMAFYDELTGLPSRRALNQDMMKLGIKYSIAMLDIDFFKRFNDSYGHDTGDEALKFIAFIIKNVTGGKAYRYGGEEFTILLPGKTMKEAESILEELRETIAKRGFVIRRKRRANSKSVRSNTKIKKRKTNPGNTKKIYIHVSIGVSNKNDINKTPVMVLKAADAALYRAKKKGRNCVSK
jgi:diguanylate cyclase (GGDEF)-like protein